MFDGEPGAGPAGKPGLSFAVNTNWDVFARPDTWYLLNNGVWYRGAAGDRPLRARRPAAGGVQATCRRTANFATRCAGCMPARAASRRSDQVPQIFVSTKPAEIIVTAGPPSFRPRRRNRFAARRSTPERAVLRSGAAAFLCAVVRPLVLGAGLDGPWAVRNRQTAAGLLADPAERPRCRGARLGAGHGAAQEAVLKAQIPTTATIKRERGEIHRRLFRAAAFRADDRHDDAVA